jgi:hypothetical protein
MPDVQGMEAIVHVIAKVGIHEKQQPSAPGTHETPKPGRKVGARNLRDELIWTALLIARPVHLCRHPGQAAKPGPRLFLEPDRHLSPQYRRGHCGVPDGPPN